MQLLWNPLKILSSNLRIIQRLFGKQNFMNNWGDSLPKMSMHKALILQVAPCRRNPASIWSSLQDQGYRRQLGFRCFHGTLHNPALGPTTPANVDMSTLPEFCNVGQHVNLLPSSTDHHHSHLTSKQGLPGSLKAWMSSIRVKYWISETIKEWSRELFNLDFLWMWPTLWPKENPGWNKLL